MSDDMIRSLRDLVERWRAEAALVDSFHATMGSGWKACAAEVADLLAVPDHPLRADMLEKAKLIRKDSYGNLRAIASLIESWADLLRAQPPDLDTAEHGERLRAIQGTVDEIRRKAMKAPWPSVADDLAFLLALVAGRAQPPPAPDPDREVD